MAEPRVVTAERVQSLILTKYGQGTGSALAAQIDTGWLVTEPHETLSPRVRDLQFELWCIDFLLGQIWEDVDYSQQDASEKASQKSRNLQEAKARVEAALKIASSATGGGSVSGTMSKKAPIETLSGPDPNSLRLRGVPVCADAVK